jgi:hypothetical protein
VILQHASASSQCSLAKAHLLPVYIGCHAWISPHLHTQKVTQTSLLTYSKWSRCTADTRRWWRPGSASSSGAPDCVQPIATRKTDRDASHTTPKVRPSWRDGNATPLLLEDSFICFWNRAKNVQPKAYPSYVPTRHFFCYPCWTALVRQRHTSARKCQTSRR